MVGVSNNDLAVEVKKQACELESTKAELTTCMDRLKANLKAKFNDMQAYIEKAIEAQMERFMAMQMKEKEPVRVDGSSNSAPQV